MYGANTYNPCSLECVGQTLKKISIWKEHVQQLTEVLNFGFISIDDDDR